MTISIQSDRVLLQDGFHPALMEIDHGHIVSVQRKGKKADIDYGNYMIVPGFIDIHTHGGYGCEVMQADAQSILHWLHQLPREGTTSLLISPYSSSIDTMRHALDVICSLDPFKTLVDVLGVYLEGPFLSKKRLGAMDEHSIIPPDIHCFEKIVQAHEEAIRICALACEEDHDHALMDMLSQKGIRIAAGHTDMTYEQALKALAHGLLDFTHCGNAMRGIHHRDVGTLGAAMLLDECYAEVIADGKHVSFALLKLLHRTKPKDKIVFITDSLSIKGCLDGVYDMDGIPIEVKDSVAYVQGTNQLAGSTLTMAQSVANAVWKADFPIIDALHAASLNPAKLLGEDHKKGRICPGYDADICVLNDEFLPVQTYCMGCACL